MDVNAHLTTLVLLALIALAFIAGTISPLTIPLLGGYYLLVQSWVVWLWLIGLTIALLELLTRLL